jgi:hypothetical protein
LKVQNFYNKPLLRQKNKYLQTIIHLSANVKQFLKKNVAIWGAIFQRSQLGFKNDANGQKLSTIWSS